MSSGSRSLKTTAKRFKNIYPVSFRMGKLVHRFRSNVTSMMNFRERLIVVLESGKAYRSNAKATRWYRIKP